MTQVVQALLTIVIKVSHRVTMTLLKLSLSDLVADDGTQAATWRPVLTRLRRRNSYRRRSQKKKTRRSLR